MFRSSTIKHAPSLRRSYFQWFPCLKRSYSTPTSRSSNYVRLVEVGPRDGLQNEPHPIPPPIKADLVNRLGQAGIQSLEVGSFVSPRWIPQMAGTAEVLALIDPLPMADYAVLVPNMKGLDEVLRILAASKSPDSAAKPPPPVTEIAIFTAATDAFAQANTNVTVSESLARLAPVARAALDAKLKVRGYVSVIITCPYSGRVDPKRIRDVARELFQMGCYEVSLGDTTGAGTPASIRAALEEVLKEADGHRLAGHFHDTNGTALANIFAALELGVRTFDTSVGGLGGCPYSPGATGNVATEDVVYALTGESLYGDSGEPYSVDSQSPDLKAKWDVGPVSLPLLAETGAWISEILGRETTSRAGRAYLARRQRERQLAEKAQAKL
ncbi:hypothetical protein PAXRUDRAFT_831036 [Paxillus rubicundulus Ve08.2h10]|uniref:hydroxymethylglutaryl-CoA lyase n=1 Tax=Paxillus rubicundulus Ve08.2h10 TaxID=930991 RepID=A0A0D0E2T2_9AGAM|nr:hypothetical protein PAXRUDRAFT_831036 [Paxillus rubicundulus Ve08.2h10]